MSDYHTGRPMILVSSMPMITFIRNHVVKEFSDNDYRTIHSMLLTYTGRQKIYDELEKIGINKITFFVKDSRLPYQKNLNFGGFSKSFAADEPAWDKSPFTVTEHFAKKYNLFLEHPAFPAVINNLSKGYELFPLELVHVRF